MNRISEADTKTLILDAAEQAFADLGFDAASLRHIISVAGVNLAAIHYHYGSKEALIEAVFSRRLTPLNKERLDLLEQIEAEAGNKPLPLEKVIEALVGPALRLSRDPNKGGRVVMRLFGRTIAEPSEQLQRLIHQQFGDMVKRFTGAFQRALPELPENVLFWRIQFVIGAMAHIMCDPNGIKAMSAGLCDPNNTEEVIKEMVTFLAAGMRAELPKKKTK
ncbi:MAG: TetR/AcrR family transcriptional regulator [Limisphaerales bacterium]